MDNIKRIDPNKKKYSKDKYSLFYPKGKKDSGFIALFVIVALAFLVTGIVFSIKLVADSGDDTALIIGLIVSFSFVILMVVGFIVSVASKPKHLDKGEGLYCMYKDEKKFKIVDEFSESSISILKEKEAEAEIQEYDEDGNPIYYAEEMFDDEDDIFVNEVNSTLIAKEKAIQYSEIITKLERSLKQYGLSGDMAKGLVTVMSFSPMIYAHDIAEHITTLFSVIKNPSFSIHYSDDVDNIAHEPTLFKSFEYAKAHTDSPIFVYIDGIPAREFMNYMRPLYAYIDNPNDDYYISNKGSTSYIPHNVFFLFDLKEGDYYYDISRRYLRYIGVLKAEVTKIEPSDEKTNCELSLKEFANAKRNALESYALNEQIFKKLDNVFSVLKEANGYVLQNKVQRKIEEYSSILLSLGEPELKVVDDCLANLIITAAIMTAEPNILEEKFHVVRLIESEFGASNMKQTKAIVKEYISLFATKGGE